MINPILKSKLKTLASSWVYLSKTSGTGPDVVDVTASTYRGRVDRVGMSVFFTDDVTRVLPIEQSGSAITNIIPNSTRFPEEGGDKAITINTNEETLHILLSTVDGSYPRSVIKTMKIDDLIIPVDGTSLDYAIPMDPGAYDLYTVELVVSMPANESREDIVEKLTVGPKTVNLYQSASTSLYLEVSNNDVNLDPKGDEATIEITSNGPWIASIKECYEAVGRTIKVVPSTITLSHKGENRVVHVETQDDVEWTFRKRESSEGITTLAYEEGGECWLSLGNSSGKDDGTIKFTASKNPTEQPRTAVVEVYMEAKPEIKQIIRVTQKLQDRFYNTKLSERIQKNDCPTGQEGSMVTYEVPANKYSSMISQADADSKAQAEIDQYGQDYANTHGTCESVFYNKRIEVNVTRNNCGEGYAGTIVPYVVEAGKYVSYISQEDADKQAEAEVKSKSQTYANQHGECKIAYKNERRTKTVQKECQEGYRGTEVQYVVEAGTYTSAISQADANDRADKDIAKNAQQYANDHGTCNLVYYNVEKRQTFSKQGCTSEQKGSEVEYVVAAGKYDSIISQEDANQQALDEIAEKGQENANKNGVCLNPFCNKKITQNFTKNDCTEGHGSVVPYTVEAGVYKSFVSQEDADKQAQDEIDEKGQTNANTNGTCSSSFSSVEKRQTFTKNNCVVGMYGSEVEYVVEAGAHTSDVSQEDADKKADDDILANGQENANTLGKCLYGNAEVVVDIQRSNCQEGYNGSYVEYRIEAGKYKTEESQEAADTLAQNDVDTKGKQYANEHGICSLVFYNERKSQEFTRDNCPSGQEGGKYTYVVEAGEYTSDISQADANQKALDEIAEKGQETANKEASCGTIYYNDTELSITLAKNDCADCENGTEVEYVVRAGDHYSYISQEDANQKAQQDLEDNAQAFANKNGDCQPASTDPVWTNTANTQCSGCTAQIEQEDTNKCSASFGTKRWANGGSRDCSANGTWGGWSGYSCSGCDYYRTRTNSCGATETDHNYGSSSCGTWGSSTPTGSCKGEQREYVSYNSCGGSSYSYSYEVGYCGHNPCVTTWRDTGKTECQSGTSKKEQEDSCNTSNKRWVDGGTACTNTNGGQTVSCPNTCSPGQTANCPSQTIPSGVSGSSTSAANSAASAQASAKCKCTCTDPPVQMGTVCLSASSSLTSKCSGSAVDMALSGTGPDGFFNISQASNQPTSCRSLKVGSYTITGGSYRCQNSSSSPGGNVSYSPSSFTVTNGGKVTITVS